MASFQPTFHFYPPKGGINDPNGLVYFGGEWHLFYQHVPPGYVLPFATSGDGGVHKKHWGHAVSPDLVNWEVLPPALAPDDLGAIWSGSCVVDEHDTSGFFDGGSGLVAIFTHFHRENHDGKTQSQSLAYSRDNGRTWTKYADNPVITGVAGDFRDPKVLWHEATARWIMVVTLGDAVGFYASPDLKSWEMVSRWGQNYGSHAGTWECPDFFALPLDGDPNRMKWILQTSYVTPSVFRTRTGECANQYFVGDFDGENFTSDNPPETVLPTSFGRDDYAAVAWTNAPDGRTILLGWMANYLYSRETSKIAGRGLLTLPRNLELRSVPEGVRLVQHPVEELQTLRGPERSWQDVALAPAQSLRVPDTGETYEINAELEMGSASEIGLRLRQGATCQTAVGYDVATQTLFIDRTRSGAEMPSHPHFTGKSATNWPAENGVVRLQIFVDRGCVEVFAGEGRAYGAEQIFPDADGLALEIYAQDGGATLRQLTLWPIGAAQLVSSDEENVS